MSLKADLALFVRGETQTLMNLDNPISIDQLADFLSGTQTTTAWVPACPSGRDEWAQKPRPTPISRPRPNP